MVETFKYFDPSWRDKTFECICGWKGKVPESAPKNASSESYFHEYADIEIVDGTSGWYSCPRWGKGIASVLFPNGREIREAAQRGNAEAIKMRKAQS
jgi:hypothetical protein